MGSSRNKPTNTNNHIMIIKTPTTGLGRVSSMSSSNLNLTLRAQFNHSPRPPGSNYFRFILVNVLRL